MLLVTHARESMDFLKRGCCTENAPYVTRVVFSKWIIFCFNFKHGHFWQGRVVSCSEINDYYTGCFHSDTS